MSLGSSVGSQRLPEEEKVVGSSPTPGTMTYICDNKRHLICEPYSIENLHQMAKELGIKRCWFYYKNGKSHYDIPKTRIEEITARCKLVTSKELLQIIKDTNARPN